MQHRGDHLPPKAGALEHVQAARQVLGTLQPRQRGASRQFGELARRPTQRPEIRLDEPGAGPKWKAERGARGRQPRQADLDGSVDP